MKKSNVAMGIICTLHITLFAFFANILAWSIYLQRKKRRTTTTSLPAFT